MQCVRVIENWESKQFNYSSTLSMAHMKFVDKNTCFPEGENNESKLLQTGLEDKGTEDHTYDCTIVHVSIWLLTSENLP